MAKTKVDRFEARVARHMRHDDWDIPVVNMTDAVQLLRREHAAIVRAVRRLDAEELSNMCDDFRAGQHNAFMKILALLAARKRNNP